MVPRDRIELPTRGFSVAVNQQVTTNNNKKYSKLAHIYYYCLRWFMAIIRQQVRHECAMVGLVILSS